MNNDERDPFSSFSRLPQVPPENIRAFRDQEHELKRLFHNLRRDNPEAALELINTSKEYAGKNEPIQRAYIEGALFLYAILAHTAETEALRHWYKLPASDDGDVGDLPPST